MPEEDYQESLPDFRIGDTKKKYEAMKKQGRCPYDSFKEFMDSLIVPWEV